MKAPYYYGVFLQLVPNSPIFPSKSRDILFQKGTGERRRYFLPFLSICSNANKECKWKEDFNPCSAVA